MSNIIPELEAGMLVELKNGKRGVLIPTSEHLEVYDSSFKALTNACIYKDVENLILYSDIDREFGIVKIWGLSEYYNLFDEKLRDLLWEYEEHVKEMTMEQVEKELGYKVKIINK